MLIDFEIITMLTVAIVFSILSFLIEKETLRVVLLSLSSVIWLILGLGWVIASPTIPVFALIFMAIGIIFTVYTVIESADMLRSQTWR